jgi:hypothetical protein
MQLAQMLAQAVLDVGGRAHCTTSEPPPNSSSKVASGISATLTDVTDGSCALVSSNSRTASAFSLPYGQKTHAACL